MLSCQHISCPTGSAARPQDPWTLTAGPICTPGLQFDFENSVLCVFLLPSIWVLPEGFLSYRLCCSGWVTI